MNLRQRLLKLWNLWPPFLFTGIKIERFSEDYRQVDVKLKLRFWNANYVGTQYGGSIFSMTDAFYMVMLMRNLGKDYVVWDKSATIHYLKPGKTDLRASYVVTEEDLNEIRSTLEKEPKMEWLRKIEVKDTNNVTIAEVDKVIHIRKRVN